MDILIQDATKTDAFTAVFQHIKLFTEQITLVCNSAGMKMQCMDTAHVAILEMTLPSSWFDGYEIVDGKTIRIGFNAVFLHRILSSKDKDQQIHLVYSSEDSDRWLIHLTSNDADGADNASKKVSFDKHFELPLIDIEEDGLQIPEIEYNAELSMMSSQFAGIITQLKMFGDTMEVKCSEERIALASTSQDQGKMFVEIGINDLSEFAIDEGADLSLSFSLTYLKHICAYSKISNLVSIKFSESFPMRVAYNLGAISEGDAEANLVFHLAPKIED